MAQKLKIATWNINSVRLRIGKAVRKFSEEAEPDIICFQETKVTNDLFPEEAFKGLGYGYIFYEGQKSYNGVAIVSKIKFDSPYSLKLYNEDARHISVRVGDMEIHNFYVPSGGDIPDVNLNDKFKHKLEYVALMKKWFLENRSAKDRLILAGDFNICPHEHDVWSSSALRNEISHTDVERKLLIDFQSSLDFIDSARFFVPLDKKFYTWWSYRSPNWRKSDRGRRLDHIWTTRPLEKKLINIISLKEARGWESPSDHVPYILELSG